MPSRTITNDAERDDFMRFIQTIKLPASFNWAQGRSRSAEQNRLQFKWANEAAHQRGDMTFIEVQHEWKLHFGIPILRRDDADFQEFYDTSIKPKSYEDKLKAMAFVSVSSELKVRQMVEYLDTIQRETLQQGIRLTDPDADLEKYHNRYRERKAA